MFMGSGYSLNLPLGACSLLMEHLCDFQLLMFKICPLYFIVRSHLEQSPDLEGET